MYITDNNRYTPRMDTLPGRQRPMTLTGPELIRQDYGTGAGLGRSCDIPSAHAESLTNPNFISGHVVSRPVIHCSTRGQGSPRDPDARDRTHDLRDLSGVVWSYK